MFTQIVDPVGNLGLTCLIALIPVVLLLVLLAVYRVSAWLAVLIGSIVTFVLALLVWQMPFGDGVRAYVYGSATGIWNVNWITFWGLMLFNTLGVSGVFENFRRWLISQGTLDIRVQTMLFAWAFGALLEGLVGFGYPWAVVAPILISLGLTDLDAIRVAAIANNAPVSYGALGAPIIALAAVTGYPLLALSGSVGTVVAVLALLPPWVLIYLVAGKEGFRDGWPLAVVGSLGYVLGQWPTAYYFGPYLPDVVGSIVCFCGLLLLLRVWQPTRIMGHGGHPVEASVIAAQDREHGLTGGEVALAWMPFAVLVVVVALWTGPWSSLPAVGWYFVQVQALAPETKATITAAFKFAPWIGGTAILASWLIVVALLMLAGKLKPADIGGLFRKTFHQMWGAMLVGVFIFGLAYVFNFLGHGLVARQGVLLPRDVVHRGGAHPRIHRRGAVGVEHLDQRDVRQVPGAGRGTARLPAAAAADAELGRRRDRQADRAADRQRRRLDQQVRAQRGRGHPAQLWLDPGAAGVSDRDRHRVPFRRCGGDAAALAGMATVHRGRRDADGHATAQAPPLLASMARNATFRTTPGSQQQNQ